MVVVGEPHPISMHVPAPAKVATGWPAWNTVPTVCVTGVICSATYQYSSR